MSYSTPSKKKPRCVGNVQDQDSPTPAVIQCCLDSVIAEWLTNSNVFASTKLLLTKLCVRPSERQQLHLSVQAYGSGEIVLKDFAFDATTHTDDLYFTMQIHLHTDTTKTLLKLLLPNGKELEERIDVEEGNDYFRRRTLLMTDYGLTDNTVVSLITLDLKDAFARGTVNTFLEICRLR